MKCTRCGLYVYDKTQHAKYCKSKDGKMRVKIKTWKAMEIEFGLTSLGAINCGISKFTPCMEVLMPPNRIIDCSDFNGLLITDEMIEERFIDIVEDAINIPVDACCVMPKKFTEMNDGERKKVPVYDGFIRYFPNAIVAVAQNSMKGNDQHNPGMPLFWDRSKSKDEVGSGARHLIDQAIHQNDKNIHGIIDAAASKAWRAMADLEKLLEDVFNDS